MEPLNPELRKALKEAHPGLTDEDIDRTEELLAQRMLCDPEKEAERIQQLDNERVEIINQKMPHYNEVVRAVNARAEKLQKAPVQKVTITIKKPE